MQNNKIMMPLKKIFIKPGLPKSVPFELIPLIKSWCSATKLHGRKQTPITKNAIMTPAICEYFNLNNFNFK